MLHIWESRRRRREEVMVNAFAPTMRDHNVRFIDGRRFSIPLPELEMRFRGETDAVLTDDLVIRQRRCLVHSERLIEALRCAGVRGIDYYACRLVNELDEHIHRTHWAANLLDVIHCIDEDASDIERDDEEPNEIWYIHRLKLIEERAADSPMFRLGERRDTVVVNDAVKGAVERAGLTGVIFLPADGYREWRGYAHKNPHNVIGTHAEDPDGPPVEGIHDFEVA